MGGGELQRGLEALWWAGQDLRHGRFAQARDEDQVAAAQDVDGGLDLVAVFIAQVGEE